MPPRTPSRKGTFLCKLLPILFVVLVPGTGLGAEGDWTLTRNPLSQNLTDTTYKFVSAIDEGFDFLAVTLFGTGADVSHALLVGMEDVVLAFSDIAALSGEAGYEFGALIGNTLSPLSRLPDAVLDSFDELPLVKPDGEKSSFALDNQLAAVNVAEGLGEALERFNGFVVGVFDRVWNAFFVGSAKFFAILPDLEPPPAPAPTPTSPPTPSPAPAPVEDVSVEGEPSREPGSPTFNIFTPPPAPTAIAPSTSPLQTIYVPVASPAPSSPGVSIYDLALAMILLRDELDPRIDLAMERPRASSNRSSGSDVDQSDLDDYLLLSGGTLTGNLSGTALNFDSGTLVVDDVNDRVGIGTTSPSDTLSVNGPVFLANVTPSATTNRLYSDTNTDLYWNGNLVSGSAVGTWSSSGGNVYRLTGNVGIGTSTPSFALDVAGDINLTGDLKVNGTNAVFSNWTTNGSDIYRLSNVGIGTTTPSSPLTVVGNGLFTGTLSASNLSGTNTGDVILAGENYLSLSGQQITAGAINLASSNVTGVLPDANVANDITLDNLTQLTTRSHVSLQDLTADDHTQYALLAGRSGGQILIGGTASGNNLTLQSTSNATKGKILFGTSAYDEVNNRLGVGNSSPTYVLDITGTSRFTGAVGINGALPGATVGGQATGLAVTGYTGLGGLRVNGADTSNAIFQPSGNLIITTAGGDLKLGTVAGAGNHLVIRGSGLPGSVGIGTGAPGSKLSVAGGVDIGSGYAGSVNAPTNGLLVEGNVGIGITAPEKKLHVVGDILLSNASNIAFDDAGGSRRNVLRMTSGSNLELSYPSARTFSLGEDGGSQDSALTTTRLHIDAAGEVGIGTSDPRAKLEIGLNDTTAYGTTLNATTLSGSDGLSIYNSNAAANFSSIFFQNQSSGASMGRLVFVDNGSNSDNFFALQFRDGAGASTAEKFRFTSAGNLGINTTGPDRKLDVLDASAPQLRLSQTDGTTYADFQVDSNGDLLMDVDGITNQLVLDNGGNVGIGTADPLTKLDITAPTTAGQITALRVRNPYTAAPISSVSIDLNADGTTALVSRISSHRTGASTQDFSISTYSGSVQERLRILSGGNVGVGISTPDSRLHVVNGSAGTVDAVSGSIGVFENNATGYISILTPNGSQRGIVFGEASNNLDGGIFYDGAGGLTNALYFRTNGNVTRMHIDDNGRVGINDGSPDFRLEAVGSSGSGYFGITNITDGDILTVNGSGNVGIGTTTPWRSLSVSGTVAFDGLTTAVSSGNALCLSAEGEVIVNTGAQTCTVSSLRFKHDVEDLSGGLETITALRAATFIYNGVDDERVGLIAEEVEKVDPRLVFREADGRPRGVRYEDIVAVLVQAVQELAARLDAVEARLAAAGTSIAGSVTSFVDLVATTIRADRVTTEELCVGTTCITEAELKALLDDTDVGAVGAVPTKEEPVPAPEPESATEEIPPTDLPAATSTAQAGEPSAEEPPAEETEAMGTEAPADDPTTDDPAPEEPSPEPEPEPEPSPEPDPEPVA